ncbi:unnamed protein product [Symbiodinium natans]|uniref:Uncharacterized protein n=1 Tax=Symbiodinium natans TaxID=878477 RepID=A0A812IH41_9DINO|nr:unnamed protein product [Symbiodinium natans]
MRLHTAARQQHPDLSGGRCWPDAPSRDLWRLLPLGDWTGFIGCLCAARDLAVGGVSSGAFHPVYHLQSPLAICLQAVEKTEKKGQ